MISPAFYNAFYIDPVTAGERGHILNNHAAVFEQMHMPEKMVCLDKVVRDVSAGRVKDMRNFVITVALPGLFWV